MALSYLWASATQGSNDAFVETEIATALTNVTNAAYRLREIYFEIAGGGVANATYEATLTRKTQASLPTIDTQSLIWAYKWSPQMTTSGMVLLERVKRFTYSEDDELLIVEDPIYFQFDSASSSATNTARIRLGYERVSLSVNDRLALITNTLTGS